MTEENNPRLVKIGELLIEVGALTSGDLTEAIQISKRMGVPIGRVLVMSGCVSEANLQQALELQSLIKDGMVDKELGFKALHIVFEQKSDLQSALKKLNWTPQKDASGNKLGELLKDSHLVTDAQLERALEASFQSGMPLGGTLVMQGILSAQLLPAVLHTQELVRDGKMSRDEAVEELKRAVMFWARADQSKQDLQSPMEAAAQPRAVAITGAPPPQQPAPAGAAPPAPPAPIFEGARAGTAPGGNGSKGKADTTNQGLQRPPEPAKPNDVSLVELMKLAGFCTQATLDHAIQQALQDSRLASKLLLSIGFLDGANLNNFVLCQALIAKGQLKTDQALYALNAVRHRKLPLDQILNELGITVTL